MNKLNAFTVTKWAAWAPGLQEATDWKAWAKNPFLPVGDQTPPLAEVPAMQRRRIEKVGRMAIQAVCWCREAEDEGAPLVFASRHGDVQRSFDLLQSLARDEPMSPTQFGLSVHNAIAALHSIARGERANYVALAAGRSTPEAAIVEALGLLADGAPTVTVVVYDAPTPPLYSTFLDEPGPFYAWAWRLAASGDGMRLSLSHQQDPRPFQATGLPHGLDVHRFLLSGERDYRHQADGVGWHWKREA